MSENNPVRLDELPDDDRHHLQAMVHFIMKELQAKGVFIALLDARHGSGSVLGVLDQSLLPGLKDVVQTSLDSMGEEIKKSAN
jgi:hypothetical protein